MSAMTQELEAGEWGEYFDSITHQTEGMLVTIEVMSGELGDQTDVERLPLQGITFDQKDNALEIAVGGRGTRYPVVLQHFISAPQTISVEESTGAVPSAILVTDAGGVRTLIHLFEPVELGA